MGYIFESEIESIINAVRAKTIGEGDGILLKKILTTDIHPAIKAYFKAEVEKNLNQERGLEYRSKKFPYSLPEVVSLQHQIDLLLVQNYYFNHQEFESLLDESIHFQFNYLCRPQWTLMNFIFGDQRRVVSAAIEKRLQYCVDYIYFPEIIRQYMIDRGLAEVTYEEFKSLLERIDREVVAKHSSLELAHMTRALFDFVESGKMIPSEEFKQQTLPINAAIVFFDDKQLADIRVRLEFERDRNMIRHITVDRLADIIEIVRTGNEVAILQPISVPAADTTEAHQIEKQMEEQITEVVIDSKNRDNITSLQVGEDTALPSKPVLISGENDEQYLAAMPSVKQKEILDLFPDEECIVFIGKLFTNDEPAFRNVLSEISLMNAWDQVAHYLDALYLANDVDPFSSEAVSFTDRLFAYFHSLDTRE